jgi:predicted CoA-binding protein
VTRERKRSVRTGRRTLPHCTSLEFASPRGCHNRDMKTVAVIGASSDRRKFGNKALRAFRDEGYKVIPINPNEPAIEGVATYPSVVDVPEKIDMATVYVPPEIGITLLDGFEQKRIPEIWINPGAESDALIAEARRRKLNVIEACSIVGIGRNPYSL